MKAAITVMASCVGQGLVVDRAIAAAPAASVRGDAPGSDPARVAEEAVREARAAAARGDYEAAADAFTRALTLRPSPALHYNLAVCHHRRMLTLPEGDAYEAARRAAIAAYNAYLTAAPQADDRNEVAATVFDLGGRPATLDEWTIDRKPAEEHDALPELRPEPGTPTPDANASNDANASPHAPVVEPRPQKLMFPLGRFGFGFATMLAGFAKRRASAAVEDLPEIAGVLRGGGFAGRQRRVAIGVELAFGGQPISNTPRDRVIASQFALAVEYGHPLLQGRLEIGGGALLGIRTETLRFDRATHATCPVSPGGRSSGRAGVMAAARAQVAALLGRKRRHELALRLTPTLALYGDGRRGTPEDGETCSDAFTEYGLTGPNFVFSIELGYAPRF